MGSCDYQVRDNNQSGRKMTIPNAMAAAIATERGSNEVPSPGCSDDHRIGKNELVRAEQPPLFYKNDFGAVTKRQQFLQFYQYELAVGRPIGPHVFARR